MKVEVYLNFEKKKIDEKVEFCNCRRRNVNIVCVIVVFKVGEVVVVVTCLEEENNQEESEEDGGWGENRNRGAGNLRTTISYLCRSFDQQWPDFRNHR